MGQRSQIYVRYPVGDKGKYGLIANWYSWNYGERMVSRARSIIEYLQSRMEYGINWMFTSSDDRERFRRYCDVNFDMRDIVHSSDLVADFSHYGHEDTFSDYVFYYPSNNDGKLFIDIVARDGSDGDHDRGYKIRYCFTDYDISKPLNPVEYMDWEGESMVHSWETYLNEEAMATFRDNVEYITDNAELMTMDQLQEMINFHYEVDDAENQAF